MNKEYRIYMNIDLFERLNKYVDDTGYERSKIIEKMIKDFLSKKQS